MPKIVQYQPNQVATQVVQQPRASDAASPQAFGVGIAQGLADAAKASFDIKQKVDTTSAEEALMNFERDKNNVLYNPDNGYFSTQGKNAYDQSTTTVKSLDDLRKKYADTLNPQARVMFDTVAQKHVVDANVSIARHATQGLHAWQAVTTKGLIENSLNNASLYWQDPKSLDLQNVNGVEYTVRYAKMTGQDPALMVKDFHSKFASSVITAALANSAASGQAMFDKYETSLEGPDKVKMMEKIKKQQKVEKTRDDASFAINTATQLMNTHQSLNDMVAEAQKIPDPERRAKTLSVLNTQYNLQKKAQSEDQATNYEAGIAYINQGGTPTGFQAANPKAWEGMTPEQQNNLLSGKFMVTDQVLFNNLLSLPREKLADVNPAEYAGKIKPADLKTLRSAVDKAKQGQNITAVQTPQQKIKTVAEQFYGKASDWSKNKDTLKQVQSLMSAVQGDVEHAEELKGGKLTPKEFDDVLANYSRQFVIQRSFAGFDWLRPDLKIDLSTAPPETVAGLSRLTAKYGNDVIQKAVNALKKHDKPVTAETILNTIQQATQ